MAGGHAYVDESSQGDYVVTSWFVPANVVVETRRTLRNLLLPNQRSLHMQTENRARREHLLRAILALEPDIRIFVARPRDHGGHASARAVCLGEVAQVACRDQVQRLVLDRNDATQRRDRRAIAEGARKSGMDRPPFEYTHIDRKDEPLLWVPDAVGWAWARGGQWRAQVSGATRVVNL